jgi:hypothetical protein
MSASELLSTWRNVGLHVVQAPLPGQLHSIVLNPTVLGSEGFGNDRDFGQFEPVGMAGQFPNEIDLRI